MTREELMAVLESYNTSTPDEQGTVLAKILDENDELNNQLAAQRTLAEQKTADYEKLRQQYTKRFMTPAPEAISETVEVSDDGGRLSYNDLFK